MISDQTFLKELTTAIGDNTITLPSLPEVALKVRDITEKEGSTASQIADVVSTDPALTARLLQVANSVLYRGNQPIDSVQMAITRLGNQLVRSLVTSLAMRQMFQATSETLDKLLRTTWEQGVHVAAISRALSHQAPHLESDQAMLAGLIHNIGSLPILAHSERYPELHNDASALEALTERLCPEIGKQILTSWGFPDSIIAVAEHYQQLDYNSDQTDYVDIVLVARLQTLPPTHPDTQRDWNDIPSFVKLGIEPEIEVVEIEGIAEEIDEVEAMFL